MEENCKISRWSILKGQLNNLTPEEFKTAVESTESAVVIDCRKPEELQTGKLFDALHVNYLGEKFLDQLESLDSEKQYFVYCRSGRRSLRTCTLFKNGGIKNVYNLDGGLNAWVDVFGEEGIK